MDTDRKAIRLFKISRFQGGVEVSKKKNEFEIPTDFNVVDYLPKQDLEIIQSAIIEIRKDSAALFRQRGELINEGSDFDTYEINFENERTFLREIIWHGDNVRILEPQSLRNQLLVLIDGVLN